MKPEFWKDPDVSGLSPFARLTYIGLWMLADDAGYFRHDVPTMALELYGWDSRAHREKTLTTALSGLREAKRIEVYECGHGFIPRLTDHQRFAAPEKRVYTVKNEHSHCPRTPPRVVDDSPHRPATEQGTVGERNGKERNGTSDARKRDDESETEFRSRVGVPAFMGGKS